jgi:hypothetical protein
MAAFLISLLLLLAGCAAPAEEVAAPASEQKAVELMQVGQRCYPTNALLLGLRRNHNETMRGVGQVPVPSGQPPGFTSLLVSPGGSWSIIVSGAGGVSCLLVWGEKWQMAPPRGGV